MGEIVDRLVGGVPKELRPTGIAGLALAISLFAPWYEKSFIPPNSREFIKDNLSAFETFSFVEGAVLLTAVGVLVLAFARSRDERFQLPGGDGAVIFAAGVWALLLVSWRLFDKPHVPGPAATVGLQWGIFFSIFAAATLTACGAQLRSRSHPGPRSRYEAHEHGDESSDTGGTFRPPTTRASHGESGREIKRHSQRVERNDLDPPTLF